MAFSFSFSPAKLAYRSRAPDSLSILLDSISSTPPR